MNNYKKIVKHSKLEKIMKSELLLIIHVKILFGYFRIVIEIN